MKQLNTTGSNILDFDLELRDEGNMIYLSITVREPKGDEVYEYDMRGDTRHSIAFLKENIPIQLNYAKNNFNRVIVKEYAERDYLFFEVKAKDQGFKLMQITGRRLGRKAR